MARSGRIVPTGILADLARERGVDSFSFEDFRFVGAKVTLDPSRLILVGGQALELWSVVLDVPPPSGGGAGPLTEDTDWLGGPKDADWLCKLLGPDVEVTFASIDDLGPNSAVAFIKRPDNRLLLMDFLRTIVGPSNEAIRRLAVEVVLDDDIRLNVLHPLLCMQSRLANLAVLPSKRTGNGQLQAEWSIGIVNAFIGRLLDEGQEIRVVIRACHKVVEIAASNHARYCLEHYGIDPVDAVTPDIVGRVNGRFAEDDWPRTLEWIRKRQRVWARVAQGRQRQAALKDLAKKR